MAAQSRATKPSVGESAESLLQRSAVNYLQLRRFISGWCTPLSSILPIMLGIVDDSAYI
ncbi:hypothetical protein LX36DRAFT_656088 [Colletotrichum falcatum]|nr:hypothetical protein LX36DRAFT_656088 [Colletotrichum falcatum]